MRYLNRVSLLGNLIRDVDVKTRIGGQSIAFIGLATNREWKDAKGEKHTQAEFHNVVCFGILAERCADALRKGSTIYLDGYLKTKQDMDTKVRSTEIVAENIIFLNKKEPDRTEEELLLSAF